MQQEIVTQAQDISPEMVESYQSQGFIHIPSVLTRAEVNRYHDGALAAAQVMANYAVNTPLIFNQTVNVWRQDPVTRASPPSRPNWQVYRCASGTIIP